MTAKVKSNLLTLTEHHNSDISNLLDQLAKEEIKFSLVQAKLSSVLTTVDEYRSENALRTSELNNFKQHFSKLLTGVHAVIPDTVAHVSASTNLGQVSSDSGKSDNKLKYKAPYKIKEIIESRLLSS